MEAVTVTVIKKSLHWQLVEKMKEEYDLEVEKKQKQNMTKKENMYLLNHHQSSLPKLYGNSMEISKMLKTMMVNLFAL